MTPTNILRIHLDLFTFKICTLNMVDLWTSTWTLCVNYYLYKIPAIAKKGDAILRTSEGLHEY